MKVEVSKLKPHPMNEEIYSLSDIDDLVSSIDDVGLLQPLVVDQKNQIISGNRRFEAVKRLGWKKVDCERVKVGKSDVGWYLVHYNKQRVKTCRELLNEVSILLPRYSQGQGKRNDLTSVPQNKGQSSRDRVASEIGLSSSQVGKLMIIDKEDPDLIDLIDRGILTVSQAYLQTQRLKKERDSRSDKPRRRSRKNDDQFTFHKKSSEKMSEVDDESIDLIFTSPPYWNKRKYDDRGGIGNEKDPLDYIGHLSDHLRDCLRVLKPTGSFFFNMGDTFHEGNLLNLPHQVVMRLQGQGWLLRNTIIWAKTNPKPSSSKTNLNPTYEFIFHLVKGLGYKYQHTLLPQKHTSASHAPRHRNLTRKVDKTYPYIPREGKNMGDWWSEEIVRSAVASQTNLTRDNEHPAPFPEDIVTVPLLQTTEEGDLVLDPFMGTGTTGKVANRWGRRFIGYDLKEYGN
jgi:DNA modification methylase